MVEKLKSYAEDGTFKIGPASKGYCVKCGEKVEIEDSNVTKTEKGKEATKGICPKCGSNVFTFKVKMERVD